MRILAVSGSLKPGSANHALLAMAAKVAPVDVTVTFFDALRTLPPFDPTLDGETELAPVQRWREALVQSDAVLIASPEYGHSLPGVLKNAIDWVIGTGELERKIVAITASVAAPERGARGLDALAQTLHAVSASIVGGRGIVRGPSFEVEVSALVARLIARVARPATAMGTASGTFEVVMRAEPPFDAEGGITLARASFDKAFSGDLTGTSRVHMLSARTAAPTSAGYVALERVRARLADRAGTFVLQHSATMDRGRAEQMITVVPDSGTDALRGLTGRMKVDLVDGKHFYAFDYVIESDG